MKGISLLLTIVLFGILHGVTPVGALSGSATFTISCTGFSVSGLSVDRDTTGVGMEDVRFYAEDGAGTVLVDDAISVGIPFNINTDIPYDTPPQFNPITAVVESPAGNGLPAQNNFASDTGTCAGLPTLGGGGGGTAGEPAPGPPFMPGDNRMNPDPAAPIAIFCRPDGIHIFAIDPTGRGQLAFIASFNQINAVGIPSVNTLIASGGGVGLFRLTSGEFQVNSTRASSSQSRRPPLQQQDSSQTIHIVQRGDNLFRIALRYGTTIDAIAAANGIVDVTRIYVGQQLIIPTGSAPPGTLPGATGVNVAAPSSAGIGSGYVFIFNGC